MGRDFLKASGALTPTLPAKKKNIADDCGDCHALVCSQKSENSSLNGSIDHIPHMLVCASPENCQDEKKAILKLQGRRNSINGDRRNRDQYPTKLALASRGAVTGAMTPSTQEEDILAAADSGKMRGGAGNPYSINNAQVTIPERNWETTSSCTCSNTSQRYHRIVSIDDNVSDHSLASSRMSRDSHGTSNKSSLDVSLQRHASKLFDATHIEKFKKRLTLVNGSSNSENENSSVHTSEITSSVVADEVQTSTNLLKLSKDDFPDVCVHCA